MKEESKKTRKTSDLVGISRHLYYELDMMFFAASAYLSYSGSDKRFGDLILESFVLHFRVVYDFFYVDRRRTDDAIAYDFLKSSDELGKVRCEPSEVLKSLKRKANEDLAHLTYARLNRSYDEKLWPVGDVAKELYSTMLRFLEYVEKDKMGAEWESAPTPDFGRS